MITVSAPPGWKKAKVRA